MKKTVHILFIALFVLSLSSSYGQIMMDGKDDDWADVPVLFNAPNNEDGVFPSEVGAVVSDIVDIKEAKAKVVGNTIYGLLRFWGGPAWPNNAYQNDHDGTIYYETRGYYHFLMDLDNDATTGWNTAWYEAHYTPVGYLISLGTSGQEAIGVEFMQEWGARTNDEWKQLNEGKPYIRSMDHWGADYSEYNGQTDLGSDYEIYNIPVPNVQPDSVKMMKWQGSAKINSSDDSTLVDSTYSYWVGHAWGNDFLEFGLEWTPVQKYFANKGQNYLNPGDVIGICGMNETPIDDWGVDMTTRGEMSVLTDINDNRKNQVTNEFSLENNYPNPFNPTTNIKFTVPNMAKVSLVVYNTLGQKVRTLVNNKTLSGNQTAIWNGKNDFGNSVPSGIYYYRMESGNNSITKSMVLLK